MMNPKKEALVLIVITVNISLETLRLSLQRDKFAFHLTKQDAGTRFGCAHRGNDFCRSFTADRA